MNPLHQYIFGIVCCALLCAGIKSIPITSGALKSILDRICGIMMILSVLSPLLKLDLPDMRGWETALETDGQALITAGQEMASEQEIKIITEQTRSYILDKANALGAVIEADVKLSEERPYEPISVTINGNLSPYARQYLESLIQNDLGIRREDQVWISGALPEN